jgi:hypothetical protein
MMNQPFESGTTTLTVLYRDKETSLTRGRVEGEDLWVTLPDLLVVGGWELKPEGVCRDELCVPLPDGDRAVFLKDVGSDTWFNLSAFARLVQQPVSNTATGNAWCFGPLGWEWRRPAPADVAPDFTLADLEGHRYTLSDYRGRKIVLALWASW